MLGLKDKAKAIVQALYLVNEDLTFEKAMDIVASREKASHNMEAYSLASLTGTGDAVGIHIVEEGASRSYV